jgi:hypothetical protein
VPVGSRAFGLGAFAAAAGDPIRSPGAPVARAVAERVGLEQGVLAGPSAFGVGAAYVPALGVR